MLSKQVPSKLQYEISLLINKIDYTTYKNYLMARERVYFRKEVENYKRRNKEDIPHLKGDINVARL